MRPPAPQPVYFRGNARTGSLTEPPFAPVTVRPVVSFSRFNPLLNQSFNLRWSPGNASARRAERFSTQRELACEWFDEADSSDLGPDQS